MLHVLVGASCNNNCIFCVEEDREGREAHARAQTPNDIRSMIDTEADGVLFTSGEPTLNSHLLHYIRHARERGVETIGLISNGRRLSYRSFVRDLVDSGVTSITISIHGHTTKLHDGLTRAPGSFEQTRRGLENVCAIKARRRLEVRTSTVVNRRNLPDLDAIVRFLLFHPVDLVVLNVMMAKGRGATHVDTLMPRYGDVVRAVRELCDGLAGRELKRVRVEDLPACFSEQLPPMVRGELEEFCQYETVGSSGVTELPFVQEVAASEGFRGDREYYVTSRSEKDNPLRSKGEPCSECRVVSRCPGIWQPYVDTFGWQEIAPI